MDRAALDVALKRGIDCSGWCPRGRLDESGVIPDRYPLRELEAGGFAERTLRNVEDSNGTLIIGFGELRGGSDYTRRCCIQEWRPCEIIDAAKISIQSAAELIADFVRAEKIVTLNVAGPRESEWPGGYDYAFQALEIFVLRSK